jgi:hypothetical protein
MSEFATVAVEWLTRPGPPNWVFLLALLTAPAYWSEKAMRRVSELLEKRASQK